MGLFDKLKRLKKAENTEKDIFDTIDKSDWLQVFSACLGKAMVIQNNAGKYVVKNRNWSVDFGQGYIAFGKDKYPVQLIGSESDSSNSWMWGWNNINNFPPQLITLANEMQDKGEEWSLDPLRIPQFDLDDIFNGHTLSIVACGLSKDDYFYYRGPHGGGAVFMAVGNVPREVFRPANISEFADLTVQCIQQYHVDHKIFTESLLQWNRTKYDWDGDTLIAHFSQDLYISFEQSGNCYRITGINTK